MEVTGILVVTDVLENAAKQARRAGRKTNLCCTHARIDNMFCVCVKVNDQMK